MLMLQTAICSYCRITRPACLLSQLYTVNINHCHLLKPSQPSSSPSAIQTHRCVKDSVKDGGGGAGRPGPSVGDRTKMHWCVFHLKNTSLWSSDHGPPWQCAHLSPSALGDNQSCVDRNEEHPKASSLAFQSHWSVTSSCLSVRLSVSPSVRPPASPCAKMADTKRPRSQRDSQRNVSNCSQTALISSAMRFYGSVIERYTAFLLRW